MLADIEAIDNAIGKDRVDLDHIEVFAPLGEFGIEVVVELDGYGVGGIVDAAAVGFCLGSADRAGGVDGESGCAHVHDAEFSGK